MSKYDAEELYKAETGKEPWLPTGPDDHWTKKNNNGGVYRLRILARGKGGESA